jgi:hypothetical protein
MFLYILPYQYQWHRIEDIRNIAFYGLIFFYHFKYFKILAAVGIRELYPSRRDQL